METCYKGIIADVREDTENYYIDLKTGLGEGVYPKADFTLERALDDQCGIYREHGVTKKAYIVTYTIRTRVVVEVDEDGETDPYYNDKLYKEIEGIANERISEDYTRYVDIENSDIEEDTECPYDPENDEE